MVPGHPITRGSLFMEGREGGGGKRREGRWEGRNRGGKKQEKEGRRGREEGEKGGGRERGSLVGHLFQ